MRSRPLVPAILLLLVLLPGTAPAQEWVDLMMDQNSNVHDVKEAFDGHWEGRTVVRGQGWKQFQRWYWFMEQRTYPSGERPDPAHYAHAAKTVKALRCSATTKSANWTSLGPETWTSTSYNPGNGRVNVIVEDPLDPSIIYAGTPSGGLWRSQDGGASWTALFDDLPSLGVSGIAIDPTDTDIIYIATGDGDGADTYSLGVLKSTDGGTTWNTTGLDWDLTQSRTTRALRMSPFDPQVLLCATSNGLWRTADGGTTWTMVASGAFRDVEFKTNSASVVYACTDQFYRSTDGGLSFDPITAGLPSAGDVNRMSVAVTPADPERVYVLTGREDDSGFEGLYRSMDGGTTFTLRSSSPNIFTYSETGNGSGGQSWYDMALTADPANADVIYAGGINVWRSSNGGNSWTIRSHWTWPSQIGYTHADIHWLEMVGGTLYCGSDGGAFKSTNGGADWTDLSAGLDIMQFYRIGTSPVDTGRVIGGSQDNGTNLLDQGSWTHVIGADGMNAAIDPGDPDILYGSTQNGGLQRSTNGGQDFNGITSDITEDGPWVTPYAISATDHATLYAGFNNIWKTTDRGNNWTKVSNWNTNNSVRALAIAPSDGNRVYAARNDGLRRTSTGGVPWTNVQNDLPQLSITSIAVHPNDPDIVYVSLSGYSAGEKLFVSTDAGANWINISANLPNVPANSVVLQPNSNGGLYLGTDMGVFYTDSTLSNWQPFMQGLPNVVVTELELNMGSGRLVAGTYGRGLWSTGLYVPSGNAPTVAIVPGALDICAGQSITFQDASLEAAPGWDWAFPGGIPSTSTAASPVVTYPASGTYQVTLTMSNGFGSGTQTLPITVQVLPNEVVVTIEVDDYPGETTWAITNDQTTEVVASGGPYSGLASGTVVTDTICLPDGCYTYTINDSYGDGICCGFGNGSYEVIVTGEGVVATGGDFDYTEETPFCLSTPVGIGGAAEEGALHLRPTSVEGIYQMELTTMRQGPFQVQVLDAMGRQVEARSWNGSMANGQVDLSARSRGTYILRVTDGVQQWVHRLVR